jgi:uncharacterized protein YlbG (UPF0298 family)
VPNFYNQFYFFILLKCKIILQTIFFVYSSPNKESRKGFFIYSLLNKESRKGFFVYSSPNKESRKGFFVYNSPNKESRKGFFVYSSPNKESRKGFIVYSSKIKKVVCVLLKVIRITSLHETLVRYLFSKYCFYQKGLF